MATRTRHKPPNKAAFHAPAAPAAALVTPRLVAPVTMPSVMSLQRSEHALLDLRCKLPVKTHHLLRESDSSAYLHQLFAGMSTFLQLQLRDQPRLVGRATAGVVVDGFAILHQRFTIPASAAASLETQFPEGVFTYGSRFGNAVDVQGAFQRVGGPCCLHRLVVGVPHYIPAADMQSLLATVPHVSSVSVRPAFAPHAPSLRRGDAFNVAFHVTGPLPHSVPLVDAGTGAVICTLRLDSIVPRQPPQRLPERPAPPPADAALPATAVWGRQHQQQAAAATGAGAATAAAAAQQPAATAQQREQQHPAAAAQQPAATAQQHQLRPVAVRPCEEAPALTAPTAPKRRPKATTGGGAPHVKVARLPGIEPGFFNRPQSSRQQGVQRAPQTMSEAALQYELEWRAQLAEMADMDMEAGASSASEYEEYGEDEDGHVSSCSD